MNDEETSDGFESSGHTPDMAEMIDGPEAAADDAKDQAQRDSLARFFEWVLTGTSETTEAGPGSYQSCVLRAIRRPEQIGRRFLMAMLASKPDLVPDMDPHEVRRLLRIDGAQNTRALQRLCSAVGFLPSGLRKAPNGRRWRTAIATRPRKCVKHQNP